MICKYFVKKYFIFLIFPFVFIPEWAEARVQTINTRIEEWDTHKEKPGPVKDTSFGITIEIPFDTFRGAKKLPTSVTITVKEADIELSSVMRSVEIVSRSLHGNLPQMDAFFSRIHSKKDSLCENSSLKHLSICHDIQIIQRFNTSLNSFRNSVEAQLSDRILYPQAYDPDKSLTEDDFKTAISLLDTDCPQTCSNTDIAKAIRHSSPEKYQQLYDKIKNKDKNCQKIILEKFAKVLMNEDFPTNCQDEKNKHHTVCKNMLKDITIISNRFKALTELAYEPKVLQTTEAQAYCLECALQSNNTESLNEFLDILDGQNRCLDLNPEEEKTIHSSTGLKPYTVKKEAGDSYSISLTMQFSSAEDYDGFVPSDQVPDHYMQKAQECLQQAPQKMVGPENEKLRITIDNPINNPSVCDENAINYILIGSSSQRDNSKKYSSDIDCPAITYQILRLLGLRDQPTEQHRGFHVQPETGNITAALEVNPGQVEKLQEADHRIQWDHNCRITISKNIESD